MTGTRQMTGGEVWKQFVEDAWTLLLAQGILDAVRPLGWNREIIDGKLGEGLIG